MNKQRLRQFNSLINETVSFFFLLMLNPKNRGKCFIFDKFDIAKYTITMFNNTTLKLTSEEKDYVVRNADLRWKNHIKESGVLEGIHLQDNLIEVINPVCGKCGITNVRIYREYGTFRREETDRCNECVDQSSKGWMIPCCLDENGNAWGYTSVPEKDCEKFYNLPEKSDIFPYWRRLGGWSDSDI